jgi:hypothetical protein
MPNRYRISDDVDLPLPVAIWVLGAHLYALLLPLVLITAVSHHWAELDALLAYPQLLYAAAGVMMAGSAFEIAQNTIDRWYLTKETTSATGTGFCDLLFYACIVVSQALIAIACMGDQLWVILLAGVLTAIFPWLYLRQVAQFLPMSVLGLLATVAAYVQLGEPVIFLQLLLVPLTLFLFAALLKTHNQVLHGFTTIAASSGLLFLVWGIHASAADTARGWLGVVVTVAVTGLAVIALRPWLYALPATPRRKL